MSKGYAECVSELYRCSPEQFVAERKRLAVELKGAGDKANAKRLEKLPRPSLSAWAVNQLWWQAQASFEELFASAARLRAGDLGAMRAHREALDTLRGRAAEILRAGSHAVSDAVLRRVSNTLAALAASGSFAPDMPGALAGDRDAPGFDATGLSGMLSAAGNAAAAGAATDSGAGDRERLAQERERQRIERERAAARAERQRLEAELQQARTDAETHAREVDRQRSGLALAEQRLADARAKTADLEARLLRTRSE